MADFILFMHRDGGETDPAAWKLYFERLRASSDFEGGSEIGGGGTFRKGAQARALAEWISGYIKVSAADLEGAKAWLVGNPVYEAGGTIEIRELPKS